MVSTLWRMCMWFGYNCEIIFCHFFRFVNLVIFWPQWIDSGYLVSATPHTILYQSFWNFAHVFSMVWRCMCMWFGYNLCINFCHFFHCANFVISWPQILWTCITSGYLVSATPHTILYQSFWNFAHVFAMVWRYAYGLDIIVNLIFCHFFHFLNFVIFWPQILWNCIDSGYHVSTTPYTTSGSCLSLFNFAHLFVHGLKMCMWFGFYPAVNVCHFSTLLTLSFSQVRHHLHRSSIYIISSHEVKKLYISFATHEIYIFSLHEMK